MKMKINEIFASIQGEGRWMGTPCVFIRFAGCNQKCPYCDTNHYSGLEYSEEEIMQHSAFSAGMQHVVLTGGEPALQVNERLLDMLHNRGLFIHMETNGSVALSDMVLAKIDWITCSPKAAQVRIQRIDELKVIWQGNSSVEHSAGLYCTHPDARYIQPCDTGDTEENARNTAEAIEYIMHNTSWKLSIQIQKILGVR